MTNRVITLLILLLPGFLSVTAQDFKEFDRLVEALRLATLSEDLSESADIRLAEPRLAYVNLTDFPTLPTYKTGERKGWMEVYDGAGHYFRKRVVIHGQGGYSLRYPKNNFSCKFCENDWSGKQTTDIRFGDWVKQDGFHFKAFYTDFSRGIGEIGYQMFEHFTEDRRPYWERGGYMNPSRARCFPDGFPVIVYLNGKFQGIYAWQLKKHRKNMNMEKHNASHIHIDGNISDAHLFAGNIAWNEFEVRNPKDLYTTYGTVYNNNHPSELMSERSTHYPPAADDSETAEAMRRSAQVRAAIVRLSGYHDELIRLEASGADTATVRQRFESYFDLESLIDYAVFFYFSANGDGTLKNWQWFTYDGHKWMVTPYDLDQTLGLGLYGQVRPAYFPIEHITSGPFYWLDRYYQQEIRQRWHDLRRRNILCDSTLVSIAEDWCERVGDTFYELERQQWPTSPCYCEAICNDGWKPSDQWVQYSGTGNFLLTTTYLPGDLAKEEGRLWEATDTVKGIKPFIRNATPDSIARLSAWIPERIVYLDGVFGYQQETAMEEPARQETPEGDIIGIYTMAGVRVDRPTRGIYIFRYRNGKSRKVIIQ